VETGSDICLVIEGSYPYVTGGVSSWVQWLMESLKPLNFAVVALIAEKKDAKERKYRLPDNVPSYEEFVVFDYEEIETAKPLRLSNKRWRRLSQAIYKLMNEWQKGHLSKESIQFLRDLVTKLSPGIFKNFLEEETAFALLTRLYEEFRGDAGFVKYFYNYRTIHLILYRLLCILPKIPKAAIYHAPGTGYGGLIACLRSAIYGGKSMITEHGIYLQEREMELLKSDWLDDPYMKDMWIDTFSSLCRWQYHYCDRLITLYEGNKRLEIEYGAPADRITVIPNGIDIERFKPARRRRCMKRPRTVGFVGRVDSVKDIKTFIQAMAIVKKKDSDVRGLVIGPTDDQPNYYNECLDLINMLDLTRTITFTGRVDVLEYYKDMDVLLLTSIKEAMPLAVMEAMACGIPSVTTDVGACRELIYGHNDRFGQAGVVRRVMDSEGIAEATLQIMEDPDLANAYAQNGINRIEALYREDLIIDRYRTIYGELSDERHRISH
jgi:glycosyltransferase involved in cell wall biosynthesis